MPTYEYRCQNCQHDFELYQSFSEESITICPECGEEKVRKVISGGAGVVFKGGGFYETDYNRGKGSDYQKKDSADGGSKGATASKDSKSESKSENKSESKSESKPKLKTEAPKASSSSKKAN
jgi:putative FmdB family regulatory protein